MSYKNEYSKSELGTLKFSSLIAESDILSVLRLSLSTRNNCILLYWNC